MSPPRSPLRLAFIPTCEPPLCCVENCVFRKCPDINPKKSPHYEINDQKYLQNIDPYWTELLKAQQKTTSHYLYNFQIYGNAKDPTVKKPLSYPVALINQRLRPMPSVGCLSRKHMFLMLSIILNLSLYKQSKQREFLQSLQKQGLLTHDILQYLQIIGHHPNTGLRDNEREAFQNLCHDLLETSSLTDSMCDFNYFNPDHMFSKPLNAMMNPYELEYLRNILECQGCLNKSQLFYLLNLVERLQEMKVNKRNEYLTIWHSKGILPSRKFSYLLKFVKAHSPVLDGKKLRKCFYALEDLMEVGPCGPRIKQEDFEDKEMMKKPMDFNKFMQKLIAAKEALAAKKAADEAARKAAEESARKAAETAAARKAAEEANRKAAEEAAKKAKEQAERLKAEEEAQKALEQANKKAAKAEEDSKRKEKQKQAESKTDPEAAKITELRAETKRTKEATGNAAKDLDEDKVLEKRDIKNQDFKENKRWLFEKDYGGKKDKNDKGKKDKPMKDARKKSIKPVEEIPPEITPEEEAQKKEEACVGNIRFTTYPLCQPRRCQRTSPATGCPDPYTSFTCLCPTHQSERPATPSRERRVYACDGTVLIFPRFS